MKAYLVSAILLGFALAGFVHERDGRIKGEARAGVWENLADSFAAVARESQSALDESNLEEDALVTHLVIQRDSAFSAADRARASRPRVIRDVVAAAGPDSAVVRVAVETVVDSVETLEIQPLRIALAASDSALNARNRQLLATEAVNLDLQRALNASRAEADAWKAARPNWIQRNGWKGALVAAGVVVLLGR